MRHHLARFTGLPVSAPDWTPGMLLGTWKPISENVLDDVDPDTALLNPNFPGSAPWTGATGHGAIASVWGGGTIATGYGRYGAFIAWNGGHGDHFDNSVYAFDLDLKRWVRLSDPFGSTTYPGSISFPGGFDGIWSDGPGGASPSVPHTYNHQCYHPGTNSLICPKLQTDEDPIAAVHRMAMFGLDEGNREWRFAAQNSVNGVGVGGGWSFYDASRDAVWSRSINTGDISRFNFNGGDGSSGGTYTNFTGGSSANSNLVATLDPVNDLVVQMLASSTAATALLAYPLSAANPVTSRFNLTHTGFPSASHAGGFTYSAKRNSILAWFNSGSAVYELKKGSGTPETATWSWTNLTSGSNTVTPVDAPSSGCFGKFKTIQYGSEEYAILFGGTANPVYAFRVP